MYALLLSHKVDVRKIMSVFFFATFLIQSSKDPTLVPNLVPRALFPSPPKPGKSALGTRLFSTLPWYVVGVKKWRL